jgi:hypothetical protein
VTVRDPSEYLLPGVVAAISALDLQPEDEAMVKLAKHLARVIDQASAAKELYCARWVLPELVRVLAELGASPAARSRIKGGKPPVELDNPVRRLRTVDL